MADSKLSYDVPPIQPRYRLDQPIAPEIQHGVIGTAGLAFKDLGEDVVEASQWAANKMGVHSLDHFAHSVSVDQEARQMEQMNPWGEAVGVGAQLGTGLAVDALTAGIAGTPMVAETLAGARAAISTGRVGSTISKGLETSRDILEQLPKTAEISRTYNKAARYGANVYGFIKPFGKNVLPQIPFDLGASVKTDKNGNAKLKTEEFAKRFAEDTMILGALHGVGSVVAWRKNSMLGKTKVSGETTDEVTNLDANYQPVEGELKLDNSEVIKPTGETEIEQRVDQEKPTMTEEQKEAFLEGIKNPDADDEIDTFISPHPDADHQIGIARKKAAFGVESVSKPHQEKINALYSQHGVVIGGHVYDIRDPYVENVLTASRNKIKTVMELRGQAKELLSNQLNEELVKKPDAELDRFNDIDMKYFHAIPLTHEGAMAAKSTFRINENSRIRQVDHPAYFREKNDTPMDAGDIEFLHKKAEQGDLAAKYMLSIENETSRVQAAKAEQEIIKEMRRAHQNYKTPEQAREILDSEADGFPQYSQITDEEYLANQSKKFDDFGKKAADPEARVYRKMVKSFDSKGFEDYFACMIGAA